MQSREMSFARDGAVLCQAALDGGAVAVIEHALSHLPSDRAGVRLTGIAALNTPLAADGAIGTIAAAVLGYRAKPVRAVLFDKTSRTNWSLGWHQDRTIAVRRRIDVEGYGPWSVKAGLTHVEPPFELLAGMLTLRCFWTQSAATTRRSSSRRARIVSAACGKPMSPVPSPGAAPMLAARQRATSGSMRRRFCMRPR